MKDTYKITNAHPPLDEKNVVNKEYCERNLLSSNSKIDILSKNITELRRGDFDKFSTKIQVNEELINEFIKSANEVKNIVNFCNKVATDTISKYNQLKLEIDNKKFNHNITNIQIDDICTTGLKDFEEINEKTNRFFYR